MPEQQQQQSQGVAMPEVSTALLVSDDYAYEAKPLPPKPFEDAGQNQGSGGMSSQFEIVSSPLNKNIVWFLTLVASWGLNGGA